MPYIGGMAETSSEPAKHGPCAFNVEIWKTIKHGAFPTYDVESHGYGFGVEFETDVREAIEDGLKRAAWLRDQREAEKRTWKDPAWFGPTATHVRIWQFCRVCEMTGLKAGCKRKKCPACNGTLRQPFVDLFKACVKCRSAIIDPELRGPERCEDCAGCEA